MTVFAEHAVDAVSLPPRPPPPSRSHRLGVDFSGNFRHSGRGQAFLEVRLHLVAGHARVRAVDAAALICRYAVAPAEEGVGHLPRVVQTVTQSDLRDRRGERDRQGEEGACSRQSERWTKQTDI